jgi:hypothetical protein
MYFHKYHLASLLPPCWASGLGDGGPQHGRRARVHPQEPWTLLVGHLLVDHRLSHEPPCWASGLGDGGPQCGCRAGRCNEGLELAGGGKSTANCRAAQKSAARKSHTIRDHHQLGWEWHSDRRTLTVLQRLQSFALVCHTMITRQKCHHQCMHCAVFQS